MIKRFIRRVLGLPTESMVRMPREQARTRRAIRSARPPPRSASVLRDAGFQAYVVGGAVRDLLLGIEPKDFDIATDARPEQVRAAVPPRASSSAGASAWCT